MVPVDVKLEINPEIIEKLSMEKSGLWTAAHEDGSDERFNFN